MLSIKEKVSALNHISVTFSSMVIRLSLNLLIGIIIARALGPNGKGLLAVIVMIGTTIINLGNLGLVSLLPCHFK